MKKVVSFLRDSKISEYTNIMSSEEVIKSLLQSQAGEISSQASFADSDAIKNDNELVKVLADVFQSLTTKAMTTREIIEYIYDNYKRDKDLDTVNEALSEALGDSIKIVHAKDYIINSKNKNIKKLSQAKPFVIVKQLPTYLQDSGFVTYNKDKRTYNSEKPYYYHHLDQDDSTRFGLSQIVKRFKPTVKGDTAQVTFDFAKRSDEGTSTSEEVEGTESVLTIDSKKSTFGQAGTGGSIFNCEEMTDAKVARTNSLTGAISEQTYFNALNTSNELIENKDNTSVAVIMLNNPNIRAGTKNSLELSTFFNILSTIELSKCQPYFNATFILPDVMQNLTGKVFKTASITQFLEGTIDVPWDNATSDLYNTLEASFVREINRKEGEEFVESTGTTTNMSAFTMPQTINNFDEVFVGHDEELNLNKERLFRRANQIHDITRPFMTIKSFNIDVAPTQGLMSFKTGKLSLILHDRTRMVDIAPFIKPDLFGSFGSEISIEYGWSHLDANKMGKELKEKDISHIAEFLDKTRVIEKYIITNSSYRISGNGQVDIDLSIAMRGPIDIRTVFLDIDTPKKISHSTIQKKKQSFQSNKDEMHKSFAGDEFKQPSFFFSNIPADKLIADTLTVTDSTNFDSVVIKKIKDFRNHFNQFKKEVGSIDITKDVSIEEFVKSLNKSWFEADKEFNQSYFGTQQASEIFVATNLTSFVQSQNSSPDTIPAEKASETAPALKTLVAKKTSDLKISSKNQKAFIKSVLIGTYKGKSIGPKDYSYEKLLLTVQQNINGVIGSRKKSQENIVKKLIGGVGEVDPFYDKEWLKQYHLYSSAEHDKASAEKKLIRDNQLPVYGIKPYGDSYKRQGQTSYVTFGCVVVAIVTSHLACIGKFDEIQIVSYTANSYCGLMSNRNIMSFLIDRDELKTFLFTLFNKEAKYTIEAIITQICQRFISTRDQICYGISSLYSRDGDKSIKPKNQNVKDHQKSVNTALQRIYESRDDKADKGKKPATDHVVFLMPKIKFSFDTLTTRESGYLKTISRISIFDQQDNPFGSVKEIMEKVYDENIILAAAQINRLRAEMLSKKDQTGIKAGKTTTSVDKFYAKAHAIIKDLETREIIIREGNSFRVAGNFKTNSLKQEFKRIMPSATYGTQNNTMLEASISTINEANLNTVYLTRPDRNSPDSMAKISFGNDLPLRILPAQADITIYGCPFVNFAQYLFLDFETGTTIDNTYAVTGIKHDMSPGKFTTSLSLSYGDVYGKYENAVQTLTKFLEDDKSSSVRFFGGNIMIEGIDGDALPDDLSTTVKVPISQLTFTNNSYSVFKQRDFSEEFSNKFEDFRKNTSHKHTMIEKSYLRVEIFPYRNNKVFAQFSNTLRKGFILSEIRVAIDWKTTYNKTIHYNIPVKNKKLNDYLNSFFKETGLNTSSIALDVINKNMISAPLKDFNENNISYIIKDELDIIKIKFSLSPIFDEHLKNELMFYYNFDVKPLTSGSYNFEKEATQLRLGFSKDFSIFDILSKDSDKYFLNDLSQKIASNDNLFYESKNKKITSIEIDKAKITKTKIPIIVEYETMAKGKTKKIPVKLYFKKEDDKEITDLFKNKVLNFLNDRIFNFKISDF